MVKIGLYVGSFNPPHLGHIKIINYILENNIVDKIYLIPVSISSKKLIDSKHRLNMLKTLSNNKIEVISDALNTNSYFNYDLLNIIKAKYNIKNSYIIMGLDNLNSMKNWYKYENILKENNIICIKRNNEIPIITKDIIFIDNLSNLSSTMIRENINLHKDKLTNEIYNYIINNKLYK